MSAILADLLDEFNKARGFNLEWSDFFIKIEDLDSRTRETIAIKYREFAIFVLSKLIPRRDWSEFIRSLQAAENYEEFAKLCKRELLVSFLDKS